VWKKEEVPARYQYGSNARIGDLIVLPDVGGMVQFRDKGKPWLGGAHGYDNFDPTMQAIFYASGPSFKKNVTHPSLPNISLYPLICRLLKIKPAPNDADSVNLDGLLKK
jgi:predicted AlkP superfamily pyrophosphatase or phosphodiesterase